MRLDKIRVENFGKLRGPLEFDFRPGLNIVYGPNESGKSTLMRAVWMALTVRSRTGGEALKLVKPYAGGVPEVSLWFWNKGSKYQVEKRFAATRGSTRLRCYSSEGALLEDCTNEHAEQRLRDIMGLGEASGASNARRSQWGLWPLLWVRQGRSSLPPREELTAEGQRSLSERLTAVTGALLAGGENEALLQAIAQEYRRYYTSTGQPARHAGAPALEAQKSLEEAQARHQELSDRSDRIEKTSARLQDLARELSSTDEAMAALDAQRTELAQQIPQQRKNVESLRNDELKLASYKLSLQQLETLRHERRKCEAQLGDLRKRHSHLQRQVEQASAPADASPSRMTIHALTTFTLTAAGKRLELAANEAWTQDVRDEVAVQLGDLAEVRVQSSAALQLQRSLELLQRNFEQHDRELTQAQQTLEDHVRQHGDLSRLDQQAAEVSRQIQAAEQSLGSAKAARQKLMADEQKLKTIELDVARMHAKRTATSEALHELRGRLAEASLLGLHDQLDAAESALQQAREKAAYARRQAEAARLLFETVETCRKQAESQYLAPLQEQIQPLLRALFPRGHVDLRSELHIEALHREEGIDSFEQLSLGAKEQIALAIRLGTASVLADSDTLPVLLDDALVATDSSRLAGVAEMLNTASKRLQIVLLTCHPERFLDLALESPHLIALSSQESAPQPAPSRELSRA